MFKVRDDYFKKVVCPNRRQNKECTDVECIFSHKEPISKQIKRKNAETKETEEVVTPAKRVKPVPQTDISLLLPTEIFHLHIPRPTRILNVNRLIKTLQKHATPKKAAIDLEFKIASRSKSIDEYSKGIEKHLGIRQVVEKDPKFIVPKPVTTSPATIPERKAIIEHFVKIIQKNQSEIQTPILVATDEEFQIANKSTTFTYKQTCRNRIYEISKGNFIKKDPNSIKEEDYYKHLKDYIIPIEKLEKFGYIVKPPEPKEPEIKRVCRRCNNPFYINEQLEETECHYHEGKARMGDLKTKYYECCGSIIGGDPCCLSKHHVFHWDTPNEMEYAIPFVNTKDLFEKNTDSFKALGIDCEMGYTTKGFELLRISAIDFFSGEEVLDLMVRPFGEVVDLNTRWSGVASIGDDALSFTELRSLLSSVMDQNTILVGHGLENDLKSMRLIHEQIVDTAILFPPLKATPTFRFSLKHLTFKYLSRDIQSGEHDSSEDSLAAIDITKYFIQRKIQPT